MALDDQRHFDGAMQAEGPPPVATDGLGVARRSLGMKAAAEALPVRSFCAFHKLAKAPFFCD